MASNTILPLHEIIGIPIADMIRAEMQAAQASMEFVENIGFRRDKSNNPDDFGELRFITFRYQHSDPSGKKITREVKIPLLSLVPLPLLQIARGEFDIVVRVEDVKPLRLDSSVISRPPGKSETLTPKRHEFFVSVDSLETVEDPKGSAAPRIRIKIEVEQSHLPIGVNSLLRKLDQNVVDQEK